MEMDGLENKELIKGIQACNKYQILAQYCNNWATKEFIICALTNSHDHQARIQKAGGQAAWCNKLKEQQEAKRGSANKGKGKEQIVSFLDKPFWV
ncbi:hypothetical protein RhiTH_000025 [Rhizoctonia solani]